MLQLTNENAVSVKTKTCKNDKCSKSHIANAKTIEAINEVISGNIAHFSSIDALMEDLNSDSE